MKQNFAAERTLRGALLGGVALSLVATAAIAQQTSPAAETTQVAQAAQTEESAPTAAALEEIVITGSRIRRTQYEVLQPTVELSTDFIDKRGLTNIADALNDMPGFGLAVSPTGDQSTFNVGQNFVNLFSLGTQRTLTLVNGRRFVAGRAPSLFGDAGPGLQVDLNVIPTAFTERIDRIAVGGSPIYGADAIAGTVNVILKDRYEGAEADIQYGISDRGDTENYRARAAIGSNFANDRGNVALAVEYNDTKGIVQNERAIGRRDIVFAPNPADTGSADGIPGQVYRENRTIPLVTFGGLPLTANLGGGTAAQIQSRLFTIPDPSNPNQRVPAHFVGGRLVPFNPGQIFSGSIAVGGDGMRLSSVTTLQSPVERKLIAGMASYELTDSIRWFAEVNYAQTEGTEITNQPVYNAPLFGGEGTSLTMRTDNGFLRPEDRAVLSAGGRTTFFLSRGSLDLVGGNENTSGIDMFRTVTGFKGDVEVGGLEIDWDAAYTYGETKGRYTSLQVLDATFPLAIDAVLDPATNQVVCRSRTPGCVPLNLFGEGMPSAEAIDYVTDLDISRSGIEQQVAEFNIATTLFELPGGGVGYAGGVIWREETADFQPGDITRTGGGRTVAIAPVTGSFISREAYSELLVPLLSPDMEIPLVHRLEAEGAIRYVDNSLAGGDTTWTVGGRYSPLEDLTVRGNYTESIRAPALTELFLPRSNTFVTATDPCATRNVSGGPNPAVRQANCRAALQALGRDPNAPFVSRVETATIQGETAGNSELTNERAKAWTAGVVITPTFLPGFSAAIDWVDIEITDAIFNLTATSLLQVCYDSPAFPNPACDRFVRTPASAAALPDDIGQITSIRTGFVNAGYTNFAGLTASVNYEIDLADYGMLELSGLLYYIDELETSVTGLGFDLNVARDEIGQSKYQGQLSAEYTYEPVSVLLQANYISGPLFDFDFTRESRDILRLDDYWRFDGTVSYEIMENMVARVAVNNILDEDAPQYMSAAAAAGTYDLIGRYYSFGLNWKF